MKVAAIFFSLMSIVEEELVAITYQIHGVPSNVGVFNICLVKINVYILSGWIALEAVLPLYCLEAYAMQLSALLNHETKVAIHPDAKNYIIPTGVLYMPKEVAA